MGSPFVGKPVAQGGSFEIPSEDTHEARVVALIDLGTHDEAYKGEEPKPRHKVLLVFELDERMAGSTFNHVIAKEYTLSFHEMSSLRALAELLLDHKYSPQEVVEYPKLLGCPVMVTVKHKDRGEGKSPVAQIADLGPVPKKNRDRVFKPLREPFQWAVGDDLASLPDWLPRYFGRPLAEKIADCKELGGLTRHQNQAANANGHREEARRRGDATGYEDETPF